MKILKQRALALNTVALTFIIVTFLFFNYAELGENVVRTSSKNNIHA